MNVFMVFKHGDAVLVAVFMLLIAMSILSWAIIFWKGWKLFNERKTIRNFLVQQYRLDWPQHLNDIKTTGTLKTLLMQAERVKPYANSHPLQQSRDILSLHLSQTLDTIRVWLDSGLTPLASIGTSAPFIGLFGTVWGVNNALMNVAAQRSAGLDVVAGPMGEALVATAIGLFSAIPAVLAYNAYLRFNRLLIQDLRHIAEQLTLYLPMAASDPSKVAPIHKPGKGA